jgi:hypothetical protein
MKRAITILAAVLLVAGCGRPSHEKPILAKINNYQITQEEFNEDFKESPGAKDTSLESKTEFLNSLISRKLILQDAQAKNLDKDPSFLKMIERFWEQSLLKTALQKKAEEIAAAVSVSDKEIQAAYDNMVKENKTRRSYNDMYKQIKWDLTKQRESQLMDEWIDELHKKASIKINNDLLKQDR